ncbi:M56 family metallopeptidase [Bacillus licheniformis]|nr:M56 family metallopeptidase [Bacillus licheniformis]
MLHELYHCKRKICSSTISLPVQIVYWFNPLVWYLSKEAKQRWRFLATLPY